MTQRFVLADPANSLPWPGVPGRIITGPEIVEIDPALPFWRACIADGSLIPAPDKAEKAPGKSKE